MIVSVRFFRVFLSLEILAILPILFQILASNYSSNGKMLKLDQEIPCILEAGDNFCLISAIEDFRYCLAQVI